MLQTLFFVLIRIRLSCCLKDLYLMGFTSVTGPVWPGGGAVIPAFEMAVRDINERSDILDGYRLNLILRDTMVSRNDFNFSL